MQAVWSTMRTCTRDNFTERIEQSGAPVELIGIVYAESVRQFIEDAWPRAVPITALKYCNMEMQVPLDSITCRWLFKLDDKLFMNPNEDGRAYVDQCIRGWIKNPTRACLPTTTKHFEYWVPAMLPKFLVWIISNCSITEQTIEYLKVSLAYRDALLY